MAPAYGRVDAMPRTDATVGRLAVSADVVARTEEWASAIGATREDTVELVLRASIPPVEPTAVELLGRLQAGKTQTIADITRRLDQVEFDAPTVVARLGAKRPVDGEENSPFPRTHFGADLDDDPVTVWAQARGAWRISDKPRVVVPLRLGHPLAVYRVAGWEQLGEESGRRWATAGQILTHDGRLDADTGERVGDATDADHRILDVLTDRLVLLPATSNPIVWLHNR